MRRVEFVKEYSPSLPLGGKGSVMRHHSQSRNVPGVTYPVVASDSEWRSIKVFSHNPLYINRVFLLLCFSSLYHRLYTRFPLSTIATPGVSIWGEPCACIDLDTEKREGESLESMREKCTQCSKRAQPARGLSCIRYKLPTQ